MEGLGASSKGEDLAGVVVPPREAVGVDRRESGGSGREGASTVANARRPDPEVTPQARRRTLTAKYKLSILEKVDACRDPGQLGSLLRREGLYSSSLKRWRRQREKGSLTGLAPRQRGPRPDPDKELLKRVAKLEKENQRLADKLEKAELIIEVQKKWHDCWGPSSRRTGKGAGDGSGPRTGGHRGSISGVQGDGSSQSDVLSLAGCGVCTGTDGT